MPKINLFFDSSALYAGVVSPVGAARALLMLAEAGRIEITISMQVTAEVERALLRKAPKAVPYYRQVLKSARIRVLRDPPPQEVASYRGALPHPADVPIAVAAMKAEVDYLVSLDRHFLGGQGAAERTGLRIGTPGDALAWVREACGEDSTNPPGGGFSG